jgi:hypothetical protein
MTKNIGRIEKSWILMLVEKAGKQAVCFVMSVLPFVLIEELGLYETAVCEN